LAEETAEVQGGVDGDLRFIHTDSRYSRLRHTCLTGMIRVTQNREVKKH
jgi:hypothetical protein